MSKAAGLQFLRDSNLLQAGAEGRIVCRKRRVTEEIIVIAKRTALCSGFPASQEIALPVKSSVPKRAETNLTSATDPDTTEKLGLIKPLEPQSRYPWKLDFNGAFKCPNVVAGRDGVIRPEAPAERSRRNIIKKNPKKNHAETENSEIGSRNNPARPEKKYPASVHRPKSSLEGADANQLPSSEAYLTGDPSGTSKLHEKKPDFTGTLINPVDFNNLNAVGGSNESMVAVVEVGNDISSALPVSTKCQTEKSPVSDSFRKWKEQLIPSGMDPETLSLDLQYAVVADKDGDRPLHIAVVHQDVILVRRLAMLVRGVGGNVDFCNHMRQTPLHLAVILKDPHLCEALLEEGANSQIRDRHGNTALHLAIENSTNECLLVLLRSKGVRDILDVRNYEGLSCLHLTILKKNMLAAYYLVKAGCDIDVQEGKNGRTALMNAVFTRHLDMVKILLRFGASVTASDYAGNTALSAANEMDLKDLIILLESKVALRNKFQY